MKLYYLDGCWSLKLVLKDVCFLSTVTCIIMQKNGAGLQTASTCFWDNSTDGKIKHLCAFHRCSFEMIYNVLYDWFHSNYVLIKKQFGVSRSSAGSWLQTLSFSLHIFWGYFICQNRRQSTLKTKFEIDITIILWINLAMILIELRKSDVITALMPGPSIVKCLSGRDVNFTATIGVLSSKAAVLEMLKSSLRVTNSKIENVVLTLTLPFTTPNRKLCNQMGEQVHVLYRQCFWAGHLNRLHCSSVFEM